MDSHQRFNNKEMNMKKENLDTKIPFMDDKLSKGPFYSNDKFTAATLAMKAGQKLPEHKTPAEAVLVCLEGEAVFSMEGEEITLGKGDFMTIPVGKTHGIEAKQNSRFVIVK